MSDKKKEKANTIKTAKNKRFKGTLVAIEFSISGLIESIKWKGKLKIT